MDEYSSLYKLYYLIFICWAFDFCRFCVVVRFFHLKTYSPLLYFIEHYSELLLCFIEIELLNVPSLYFYS